MKKIVGPVVPGKQKTVEVAWVNFRQKNLRGEKSVSQICQEEKWY